MIAFLADVLKDGHEQLLTVLDSHIHLESECGTYANCNTKIYTAARFARRTSPNLGQFFSATPNCTGSRGKAPDRSRAWGAGAVPLPLAGGAGKSANCNHSARSRGFQRISIHAGHRREGLGFRYECCAYEPAQLWRHGL